MHIRTPKLCTFGRPTCAHSDARFVHIRTPEVCTFGRPSCAHSDARVYVSKDVCLVGGHIVMDPNIGFVGSGVCEKKYRFYFYRARCCPPLPPEWVKVEIDFSWPNLSEIKYRFCRRKCPFDGSTTLTLWGKGATALAGILFGRYFFSQTQDLTKPMLGFMTM